MYHHMNNSVYYYLYAFNSQWYCSTNELRFDSVVNTYLIQHCSLDPPTSPQIVRLRYANCM
jgi:acyl-CoA thioester hydrolase